VLLIFVENRSKNAQVLEYYGQNCMSNIVRFNTVNCRSHKRGNLLLRFEKLRTNSHSEKIRTKSSIPLQTGARRPKPLCSTFFYPAPDI
jgi:hypothetical protein